MVTSPHIHNDISSTSIKTMSPFSRYDRAANDCNNNENVVPLVKTLPCQNPLFRVICPVNIFNVLHYGLLIACCQTLVFVKNQLYIFLSWVYLAGYTVHTTQHIHTYTTNRGTMIPFNPKYRTQRKSKFGSDLSNHKGDLACFEGGEGGL